MQQVNLYNTTDNVSGLKQNIYDCFNGFIFSDDRNVFNKLYMRIKFYEMTRHVFGDIVECGVFKGSGILTWLKILDMNEPNSIRKVIGFDHFDPSFVNDLNDPVEKRTMGSVFTRVSNLNEQDLSKEAVQARINDAGIKQSKYELVAGDVCETTLTYKQDRPGARISVLYLDMDLYKPTKAALDNLWDMVVPGGIVVFDEHAYHAWTETKAVEEFCVEKWQYVCHTNVSAPTAFIIKS